MSMQLRSERPLPVDMATAWAALNDDETLRRCIPGCESLAREGQDMLVATVCLAVGPVKARFSGTVRMEDVRPPEGYRLVFDGQGGMAGFGKGTAVVQLTTLPDGGTLLTYDAVAQVGGKIAQIGARLVNAAAQKIAAEFFTRFERELATRLPL
ncbi:carbon monoxide dehydrogenase subunit G [Pseudacidovorax sp. 1753]|uniref:CoxG family protein n=1 Tax=Pseudacidovorax sp. 1753 TaxID=3156419 RepID=UPI00339ABED1